MLNDDVQASQWGLQYSLNIQVSKMEVKTLAILCEGAVLEHFPKGSKVIRFITYKSLDRVQWAGGRAVLCPMSQARRRQTAGKQISVTVFIQCLGQRSLIFHGLSSEWLFLKESWEKKGGNPILRFISKCPDSGCKQGYPIVKCLDHSSKMAFSSQSKLLISNLFLYFSLPPFYLPLPLLRTLWLYIHSKQGYYLYFDPLMLNSISRVPFIKYYDTSRHNTKVFFGVGVGQLYCPPWHM